MNNILLPVQIKSIRDHEDRSCVITMETRELDNREFGDLRDLRGMLGWVMIGLNEIQEEEMPKENAEVGSKSPSQRLRGVMFIKWKQEKEDGETDLVFDIWYASKMEGIIEAVKKKIK